MKGNSGRGNQLAFGSFGLKNLENCWLTAQQIEAARQAISRRMNREGQIWIRVLGKGLVDKSLLFDTYTETFDLEQTRLRMASDLSGFSDTRLAIGATSPWRAGECASRPGPIPAAGRRLRAAPRPPA